MAISIRKLGEAYFELKNYPVALDYLDKAVTAGNKDKGVLFKRGKCSLDQQDYQAAVKELRRCPGRPEKVRCLCSSKEPVPILDWATKKQPSIIWPKPSLLIPTMRMCISTGARCNSKKKIRSLSRQSRTMTKQSK